MNLDRDKIIVYLTAFGLGLSPFTRGIAIWLMTVTASALMLCIGTMMALIRRMQEGKSVVPLFVLKQPAIISCLVYMLIGVISGFWANDQPRFYKEVIQRTVVILVPLYLLSMGPRNVEDMRRIILAYVPFGCLLAVITIVNGLHGGFLRPVYLYTIDMHKNEIGASCATLGIIALSVLITTSQKRRMFRFTIVGILALIAIVAAQARASMISLALAGFAMMAAARFSKKKLLAAGLAAAVVGGIVICLLPKQVIESAISTSEHGSNAERIMRWTLVYDRVTHHPFLPLGWGNPLPTLRFDLLDTANVILYDWMQMSIFGVIALLVMIFFSIKLAWDNAAHIQRHSILCFINLVALGLLVARFAHAMLDTFWVGRGQTLTTFIALGIALWVRLWLYQNSTRKKEKMRQAPMLRRRRAD